jgi:GT2 family glycosyltransferase
MTKNLRVCVLTATRDRLAYSQACFESLHANAGCDFDHLVLDNGSRDGTVDWLVSTYRPHTLILEPSNVGINRAVNRLVDKALEHPYDVLVKIDNDAELLTPNTLRDVCEAAVEAKLLLSPRIHGLNNPPPTISTVGWTGSTREWRVDVTAAIGGIFMAVPRSVYEAGYRNDETNPLWGGDDTGICRWHRERGGIVGYLDGYDANHYLGTSGQWADLPWYFDRTRSEGKVAL